MPLIRRLPKRGFNNAAFHRHYAIVNLDDLNEFKAGTVVNEEALRESKLIRGDCVGIKILGDGELKHGLKIEADKFSASAREKIEKAGGTIIPRSRDEARTPPAAAGQEDVDLAEKATEAAPAKAKRSTSKSPAKAKSSPKKKPSRKK